ncbi:TPA: hypothetical protein ACGUO9_004591 [Vibrio vulnificus]
MARIYRNREQWSQIIEQFNTSDMSVASFCRIHQINPASFYQRRKQLSEQARPSESQPMFVEITQPDEPGYSEPANWDIELELGQGVILRMRHAC